MPTSLWTVNLVPCVSQGVGDNLPPGGGSGFWSIAQLLCMPHLEVVAQVLVMLHIKQNWGYGLYFTFINTYKTVYPF